MPMTQVRFMKLPLFTYWSRSPRIFAVGSILNTVVNVEWLRGRICVCVRCVYIMKIDKKQINVILGSNSGCVLTPVVKNKMKK